MRKKSPPLTFLFLFRNSLSVPDLPPEQMEALFDKWMTWMRSLKARGHYLGGNPLEDAPAKVLRGKRGAKATDGPYAEAKEVVAGYMLIAAKNFAEAVKISRDCPGFARGIKMEIRQIAPLAR